MKWILLRNLSLRARHHLLNSPPTYRPTALPPRFLSAPPTSPFRLFSSDNDSPPKDGPEGDGPEGDGPEAAPEADVVPAGKKPAPLDVPDVTTREFKSRIQKYLVEGDDKVLPSIVEAVLQRKLSGKHEESDEEILEELREAPFKNVDDEAIASDFDNLYSTDEEIENLYSARDIVTKRLSEQDDFNMNEQKYDEYVREAIEQGYLRDTKECEDLFDDMHNYEKFLPEAMKKKIEEKFNELGDKCEKGELEPEEASKIFKEFEDQMVMQYEEMMEAEGLPMFEPERNSDDPPGEGPILRWESRVVISPGPDAWHPKNRLVKLSVTVKELGLSKYQFRRLRELVGKRYHPGKDELTITSERFEHREENRKDCLRTLYALIEEAGKANKLADDARTSYLKEKLRANPQFMERLRAKKMASQASSPLPA